MTYHEIYFFVEGSDDERFLKTTVIPLIDKKYRCSLHRYSGMSKKKVVSFLKSINAMNFADYILLGDINHSSCITKKKGNLIEIYEQKLDENKTFIVVKEIESWYLAGLDEKKCEELGIKSFLETNNVTKEQFNDIMPAGYDSRIDFMVEILKSFSMETAIIKNNSFQYFMGKLRTKFEEV